MAVNLQKLGLFLAAFAVFYQVFLQDLLLFSLGIARVMQKIDDFPYNCRRIRHDRLEGCEDLWLDDEERVLYATCAGSVSRSEWNPSMSKLNVSGRRPEGSELMALKIDTPGSDGLYGLHKITIDGYDGAVGDSNIDMLGFDVEKVDSTTLRFWIVNQRPPVDENRKLLDATKLGANATVEVFELQRGSTKMVHVKTVAHPNIFLPNNIALVGNDSFVLSNDHSQKVGLRKQLDPFFGGGNVVFCSSTGSCKIATPMLNFPNGLTRGADGLIYVPSAFKDAIRVMQLQEDGNLKQLEIIKLGMPVDNLSTDLKGDIYAAGFPKLLDMIRSIDDPFGVDPPSTIWRITKTAEGYQKHKVLEDRDGRIVTGVTTVRHDAKTGRLFMGGAFTPYISVCDPK